MPTENKITFPRQREGVGTMDNGHRIGEPSPCSNCGSEEYYQTVSIEHCPKCGLFCDYWGQGINDVYKHMMAKKYLAEEERQAALESEEWS